MFSEASVLHWLIATIASFFLSTQPKKPTSIGVNPFWFETTWSMHRDFVKFTRKNWEKGRPLHESTKNFVEMLNIGIMRCMGMLGDANEG